VHLDDNLRRSNLQVLGRGGAGPRGRGGAGCGQGDARHAGRVARETRRGPERGWGPGPAARTPADPPSLRPAAPPPPHRRAQAPILVEQRVLRLLEAALWRDTAFLSALGVMDYSLLVGVDRERNALVVAVIDFIRWGGGWGWGWGRGWGLGECGAGAAAGTRQRRGAPPTAAARAAAASARGGSLRPAPTAPCLPPHAPRLQAVHLGQAARDVGQVQRHPGRQRQGADHHLAQAVLPALQVRRP
jgi:hypothetical protein